jgi:EmrB/QacA subfamily drug resistance transporter
MVQSSASVRASAGEAGRGPWAALFVLCLGSFAILLDATILNVAIPSMIDTLGASLNQVLWVLNAYLLAFAVLLITAARLGDVLGQRNVFALGLTVFTISSAACGLAPEPNALIGARVAQGVGAALLAPQALAIIMATFPVRSRGAAMGVFSGMTGLAAVGGPTLGGLIVTYLDWRWVFFVNVPLGVVAIVLAFLLVPDVRTGRRHRFDVLGVLLASAGLLGVLYGLIEGQRYRWGEVTHGVTVPEIIGAGALLLVAFVIWERFRPEALLPLSLFRNRNFAVWSILTGAPWFALSGAMLTFSINNQTMLGMGPLQAGLTALPMTLVLAAAAPFSGRLTDRLGGKSLVVVGLLVYAAGLLALAAVDSVSATSFTFTIPLVIAGAGLGCIFAPLTTEALRETPPPLAGAASGLLNTNRQLGGALGTAVIGAVLQNRLAAAMHDRAVAASVQVPPPYRRPFVGGFANAVSGGLQLGRGESGGVPVPAGAPGPLDQQLQVLIHGVFVHGFVDAMLPTMAVAAVVPVLGALACVVLVRRAVGSAGNAAEVPVSNEV